jgi:hypothetical protein
MKYIDAVDSHRHMLANILTLLEMVDNQVMKMDMVDYIGPLIEVVDLCVD